MSHSRELARSVLLGVALCLVASCAWAQPAPPSNLSVGGGAVVAATVNTQGSASTAAASTPTHTFADIVNLPNTTGITLVGLMYGDGDLAITSVTLGGASVTQLIERDSNDNSVGGVWLGWVLNSAIGSTGLKALAVTHSMSAGESLIGGVVCVDGQHTSTPLGTAVSAAAAGDPTVDVTDSVTGDLVIDAVAYGSAITSSNQTQEWQIDVHSTTGAGNGGQASAAGGGTVTMSWTVPPGDWYAIAAVTVKQAAGGAAVTYPQLERMARGIERGILMGTDR